MSGSRSEHAYLEKCIIMMESLKNRSLLQGLGELVDEDMKKFVRLHLKNDFILLLRYYRDSPIIG